MVLRHVKLLIPPIITDALLAGSPWPAASHSGTLGTHAESAFVFRSPWNSWLNGDGSQLGVPDLHARWVPVRVVAACTVSRLLVVVAATRRFSSVMCGGTTSEESRERLRCGLHTVTILRAS